MVSRPDRPSRPARGFLREHGSAAIGLLTALFVMVLAGPAIASRVNDGLQQTSVAALPSAIETPAPQPSNETPTALPITTEPSSTRPDGEQPTAAATPAAPMPSPAVANAQVTKIQTVPALPDMFLDVAGRRVITDENGAVELRPDDADATVRFIGPAGDPPIQTVELSTWSDGSTDLERSLTTIEGPVAEIGLTVRSRVLLQTDVPAPTASTATFSTQLGNVDVQVGEITWVAETVTTLTPSGIVPTSLIYVLDELASGDVPAGQTFRPTPEATWRITT